MIKILKWPVRSLGHLEDTCLDTCHHLDSREPKTQQIGDAPARDEGLACSRKNGMQSALDNSATLTRNVPVISRCFTLTAGLALLFRNVLDEVSYVSYTMQRIEGHPRNNLQHYELGVP